MNLFYEKWHPIALAVLGGIAWWYFSSRGGPHLPKDEKEFFAAALSMGAVLTGFVATAQAILMALPSDSVMGRLRTSGYVEELTSYIGAALLSGFLFCVLNLLGFCFLTETVNLKLAFSTIWFATAIYSALAFLRVTGIMSKIMRHS